LKLEPKKILFTGGGSGIALELARRHAEANKVVIAGRDEAKLERAPRWAPSCS
jgi:short-subunit dehydrogenase involved in D-alanine esterification of teichoic acids